MNNLTKVATGAVVVLGVWLAVRKARSVVGEVAENMPDDAADMSPDEIVAEMEDSDNAE